MGLLDVSLFALLPYINAVMISVSVLILALFLEERLFFKMAVALGLLLALISQLPWFIFITFFLIWALMLKKIFYVLFLSRSFFSLLLLYGVSYASFVLLFLAADLINGLTKQDPFNEANFLKQLARGGKGLLVGLAVVLVTYALWIFLEKKFKSFFFMRTRNIKSC